MKKGEVYKLDNLLTEDEVSLVKDLIANLPAHRFYVKDKYGRLTFDEILLPTHIVQKLTDLVNSYQDTALATLEMVYPPIGTRYGLEHKNSPNLPPHYDGDSNDVIIDYQLESSSDLETQWPLGVNLETYPLKDNQALIFNPNANIHWRPIRTFKEGEYVTMLFFRFYNPANPADNSHLPNHPQDRAFDEVNAYRDQLAREGSEL